MTFKLYTQEDAPKESQKLLQSSLATFGMVPNLHAVMAESAPLLEAYQTLHTLFQQTSFNAEELTVVWQTINVEHDCHYCVPAHTGIAHMMKVDNAIIEALRNRTKLPTDNFKPYTPQLWPWYVIAANLLRMKARCSLRPVTSSAIY